MRLLIVALWGCFFFSAFLLLKQGGDPVVPRLEAPIQEKVVICGVCRNVEKAFSPTIASIEDLGSQFLDYRVVVYENNSTDQTKKRMKEWAKGDRRVLFLSEQLSSRSMKTSNRCEKIARARNVVLDEVLRSCYDDYKYVIWADLDFETHWDVASIVETILYPEQSWDAVLGYGDYDLFALRSPEWPIGFELAGNRYWERLSYLKERFVLDRNGPWKRVYSAFGGLGIYKREAIRGCRYSGRVTEDLDKVASKWIAQARIGGGTWLLSDYDELVAGRKQIVLQDFYLEHRENYPEEIGVKKEGGECLFFSCTPDATFPWTCEHVPFHAAMIARGHDRIFINPKIRSGP